MATIKINLGSDKHGATVYNQGVPHFFDFNALSKDERNGVGEFLTNYWCNNNGYGPMYRDRVIN
jgi:hypothetical protein